MVTLQRNILCLRSAGGESKCAAGAAASWFGAIALLAVVSVDDDVRRKQHEDQCGGGDIFLGSFHDRSTCSTDLMTVSFRNEEQKVSMKPNMRVDG